MYATPCALYWLVNLSIVIVLLPPDGFLEEVAMFHCISSSYWKLNCSWLQIVSL